MTNNEKIASEIRRELELQKKYKSKIDISSKKVENLRKSLVDSYPNFIDRNLKTGKDSFVSIDKFPTTEEIRAFYQYGSPKITDDLLIYEYGWFDIKELAAIIKVLYSLKRQKEYQLLTLSNFEIEYTGPTDYDKEIVPYVNFLIGVKEKIKYLDEYNGKYFEQDTEENFLISSIEKNIFEAVRHQNLVSLKQRGQKSDTSLCIDFDDYGNPYLFYNEPEYKVSRFTTFSSRYNIFDRYFGEVIRRLDVEPRRNIGALLSFSLDFQDNFIAKALYSIVIYKKKMGKLVLSNDDYKYIFYELFKEDIDISKIVDKEIPKVLTRYK